MQGKDFYRAIREERRRLSRRQATDEIRASLELLNRLLFGEGRVQPDDDPDEDRVVSAGRLMPLRQRLKLALLALQEAEE